ncbi:group-specific protein [Salipaludibacillus neizhouensis]|uniref:Group-specific protein n=1 Tax=Salipaludibacillus neizhouensis TaxID=885475 RepID=A0A3A9K5L4_9BACI|nr:group-specific protein [Salipaludibacillus neizhouensis]RKL65762.1 group-specific protein [Salipaludibacillus neizhouensis]
MKFYTASSFKNIENVRFVSKELIKRGYILTYDWTKNERASTIDELKVIGQEEKDAVIEADFIIVLLPAGKGSHIEMGIVLGQSKKVFLYSPNEEVNNYTTTSTFYHLSEVKKCIGTLDDLINIVFKETKKHD